MAVAPDRPKGPPLNAMRAFEAAARLESFVAAGEELSVTPGAISQHVKTLEAWVGRPLFTRNPQGVELTALGRALLPDMIAAFDALGAATHALRNEKPGPEIHIAALPSIAQLWLPSRLASVRAHMPDLRISVTAMETPPNLGRELFDISVFFREPDAGGSQIEIGPDVIFPVCAPHLARVIEDAAGLNAQTLLHDQTWGDDWAIWSETAGLKIAEPKVGPRYSLYSLALEEAKSGAGVLMGHAHLVESALQSGSLVRVLDREADTGKPLVIDLPDARRQSAHAKKAADFLTR